MAKEIKLVAGDINVLNGKIQVLEGEEKLKQQVSKIILTEKGGRFHPEYGSSINSIIGRYSEEVQYVVALLKNTLEEALLRYQEIQVNQELLQDMTDEEVFMSYENLDVSNTNNLDYYASIDLINRTGKNIPFTLV